MLESDFLLISYVCQEGTKIFISPWNNFMTNMLIPSSVKPYLHHKERLIVKKNFPTSQ